MRALANPDPLLRIGPYTTRNNFALAPMAGLTDVPFRAIAWEMGAGYMVSEMLGSKAALWDTGKSRARRVQVPGVDPVAVQIAGTEPEVMAEAARRHCDEGAQIIDLNFGCPAKKVCRKAAGSAMLADLDTMARIVEACAGAVDAPVTVKTRIGLEADDLIGLQAARAVVDAGAQMVVLHGRTRAQKFTGSADHAPARRITGQLSVPVLVNGDIVDAPSAARAMSQSGADGVMIGRGAMGQPWLFRALRGGADLSLAEKLDVMLRHIRSTHEFYGAPQGVRIARKHIEAYIALLLADWPAEHLRDHLRRGHRLQQPQEQLAFLAETVARLDAQDWAA
ncbi:MAG: tRNA dihydrouridine synthase DusB [Pseudomonadota bacterium]